MLTLKGYKHSNNVEDILRPDYNLLPQFQYFEMFTCLLIIVVLLLVEMIYKYM